MSEADAEAHLICHVPEPGEPDHVWWFGFDCGHAFDFMPAPAGLNFPPFSDEPPTTYKTLDYVRRECAGLAAQLAAAGRGAA